MASETPARNYEVVGTIRAVPPTVDEAGSTRDSESYVDAGASDDANGSSEVGESSGGKAKDSTTEQEKTLEVEPGSVNSWHQIYRIQGKKDEWYFTSECPKDAVKAAEDAKTAKYAFVVRSQKSNDSRKMLEAHSIVVQSPWLKKALGTIFGDYPGVACDLERLVFETPFEPFIHHWPDLLQYLEKHGLDQTTKEHLTLLIDLLKEELGDSINAYADYISQGVTTFEHAWMVFQPGGLVISEALGQPVVYELQSTEYAECRGVKFLWLTCHTVDWNGTEFGRGVHTLKIQEYKSLERIANFGVYPLRFHDDEEAIRTELIERGGRFEALAGHHFKSYEGPAITWDDEGEEIVIQHSGRIVVDYRSFSRFGPYVRRKFKNFKSKDKVHLSSKKPPEDHRRIRLESSKQAGSAFVLDDEFKLLCNCRIRGYSLGMKKWLEFFVSDVTEIVWNAKAFDALVLPEDQKELILSFAQSQVENRAGFDDVVRGKGQGVIILLSGKPGIGKTLTAESVAESMRVPLHTISSGDLGTQMWEIDRNLTRTLDLIGRWNAVLLVDECDVFLETRANHDLHRNAIVSLWLRTLEYYSGILFLTTNRADNIDPAFDSRIHVSMEYPDLNTSSRRRIWSNFLSTQQNTISNAEIDELAELDLNGRQIKNIIKISHLLASHKKQNLRMEDIDTVLSIEKRRPEKLLKQ